MSSETVFIFESPTWRANIDWGQQLGYSETGLQRVNKEAVRRMVTLRDELQSVDAQMVVSGCIGPRGDGYEPGSCMTAPQAEVYHAQQIATLAETDADVLTAMTMTNMPEAMGIALAAKALEMPVIISFTLETDGHLPTGQSLPEAIATIDAETANGPLFYMINCAHPTHFKSVLDGAAWMHRLKGIRVNASKCSHAELDDAETLDDGNPHELGQEVADLRRQHPSLMVLGGCCGTDHRHIEKIAEAVQDSAQPIGAEASCA